MKTIETFAYTLPAHWASALINDDYSGLEDEDEQQLTDWLHAAQPGYCVGCSDTPEDKEALMEELDNIYGIEENLEIDLDGGLSNEEMTF